MNDLLEKLASLCRNYPPVKLAYLFGSRAAGDTGPLSDYDIAVYMDEPDKKKRYDLILSLRDEISRELKTDAVDLVDLATVQKPELKYQIVKDGALFFEREPYKVLVEPKILNEYFDFHAMLLRHGLTHAPSP